MMVVSALVSVVAPQVAGAVVSVHLLSEQEVMVTMVEETPVTVEVTSEPGAVAEPEADSEPVAEPEPEAEEDEVSGSETSKVNSELGTAVPVAALTLATRSASSLFSVSIWNLFLKAAVELEAGDSSRWTWKRAAAAALYKSLAGISMTLPAPAMSLKIFPDWTSA